MSEEPESNQEPKKRSSRRHVLDTAIVLVVLTAIGLAIVGLSNKTEDDSGCGNQGRQHYLSLNDDSFRPDSLTAKRCDSLHITNASQLTYDLSFGEHDQHLTYPGYRPSALQPSKDMTIRLVQTGSYEFHDHLRDKAHLDLKIED